jgi:hypothetical protein
LLAGCVACRVWLPSWRFQPASSLRIFFNPQRSWAFPFRAFFLRRGRPNRFGSVSPLTHFTKKPLDLLAVPQRLDPPSKAVPPAPGSFTSGRGPCSLGRSTSRAFSRKSPRIRRLSDCVPLSPFASLLSFKSRSPGPQGCRAHSGRHFPLQGAGPPGLSTDCIRHLFKP